LIVSAEAQRQANFPTICYHQFSSLSGSVVSNFQADAWKDGRRRGSKHSSQLPGPDCCNTHRSVTCTWLLHLCRRYSHTCARVLPWHTRCCYPCQQIASQRLLDAGCNLTAITTCGGNYFDIVRLPRHAVNLTQDSFCFCFPGTHRPT
jgi:hypothetical protein